VNAGTKEQDALLLADDASDLFNDVINFQVKRRDVTPLIGVRDPPSAYATWPSSRTTQDHMRQAAAGRHRDPWEYQDHSESETAVVSISRRRWQLAAYRSGCPTPNIGVKDL
jgi:hypothetical protein